MSAGAINRQHIRRLVYMDMIIKNGTVVTASDMFKADIGIENGKIVEISGKIDEKSCKACR